MVQDDEPAADNDRPPLYTFGEREIEALSILADGGDTAIITAALRAWLARHPPVECRQPAGSELIRALAEALDPAGGGALCLRLSKRRRGRPVKIETAMQRFDIGCDVFDLIQQGHNVDAAVYLTEKATGHGRQFVYECWSEVKAIIEGPE